MNGYNPLDCPGGVPLGAKKRRAKPSNIIRPGAEPQDDTIKAFSHATNKKT